MVKVIRKAPAEKPRHANCTCGVRLEFTSADIQTMAGDRPGDPSSDYITCPDCKDRIWLKR